MSVQTRQGEGQIALTNGKVELIYALKEGKAQLRAGNGFCVNGIHSAVQLSDGTNYDSAGEKAGECQAAVEEIADGFGKGKRLSVSTEYKDGRRLYQNFYLYEEAAYLLAEAGIIGKERIGSREIAVLKAQTVTFQPGEDMRFLFTPFDNDDFVRYAALPFSEIRESYEVSAVYDAVSRNGMIAGSISHSTWKTGIRAKKKEAQDGGAHASLEGLEVIAGVTSKLTRDTLPHGIVYGTQVDSPKIFLGFYEDYREGLEAYGRANGIIAPPLPWDKGVPVGWNSWAAVATEIDYDIYTKASDFVKEELMPAGYCADGRVYINFDAFWDRLTEEERIAAAKHVKENGQIPGIYTTPFTYWGPADTKDVVPGTGGKYHWQDILLKDEQGKILPPIDGGLSIDPTHPGNKLRLEWELNNFKRWGFAYVKMDFMAHGAVEGVHYDKEITTGIAAYNFGMQQIDEILAEELKEQDFFISLSIAPIFPAQYAHGRRISCDVFGTINWTEYMLNSLSYGWWLNENVYRFNDPDHVVLYNSYNHREESMFNEGLSRFFSAAIAGTMLLNSDDYRQEGAKERAKEILTKKEVLEIVCAGKTFRPVEGNTGEGACDCFVRRKEDGSLYLAVFNFSNTQKKEMELSLKRLGLQEKKPYLARDIWSGEQTRVSDCIRIALEEAQPKIFVLEEADC